MGNLSLTLTVRLNGRLKKQSHSTHPAISFFTKRTQPRSVLLQNTRNPHSPLNNELNSATVREIRKSLKILTKSGVTAIQSCDESEIG
jgi:hypothetical protein